MDMKTKRVDHIEDVLVSMHFGQWFGWSDSKNKIYENLIIHPQIADGTTGMKDNPHSKPTEKELTDALAQRQSDFDAQEYARKRKAEFPTIEECVHAILDDDLTALQEKRQAVKTKYPKG